jgi:hypothetical protein
MGPRSAEDAGVNAVSPASRGALRLTFRLLLLLLLLLPA